MKPVPAQLQHIIPSPGGSSSSSSSSKPWVEAVLLKLKVQQHLGTHLTEQHSCSHQHLHIHHCTWRTDSMPHGVGRIFRVETTSCTTCMPHKKTLCTPTTHGDNVLAHYRQTTTINHNELVAEALSNIAPGPTLESPTTTSYHEPHRPR